LSEKKPAAKNPVDSPAGMPPIGTMLAVIMAAAYAVMISFPHGDTAIFFFGGYRAFLGGSKRASIASVSFN